ncbi:Gfo/Idh/MocA family oxidoreductase [Maribacter sp. ANRC-HE7]|uniref:Gfo/Idh/MocA family oxidoreductase n=1 Tax=Maribacter aquimaris TaxID=2737171 RepID=A0ABR7UZQ7_9FLAO|nr:Gfo/Idh/MocA family oxidoreductase [Maribacter aquimaris]MBD0777550.1 Gfo/Idh/MocA family oxidoreductase [Maribacter aquimaris]
MENKRRDFIKKAALGVSSLSIGGVLPGFSAKSYGNIIGSNERLKVACMGVNSRGYSVGSNFALQSNCDVVYSCDVDKRASAKFITGIDKIQNRKPKHVTDFREALDDKNVDILVVTAPDHWHAPAAIMACKAGKHVYLEKPASHNPNEGELAVAASIKYDRVVQMGNQRRSWPNVVKGIKDLKEGIIGRPYFAKTWYTNNRPTIGKGKVTEVPDWLDYELWQGPAPREAFRDNLIHYNWHWFWNWGTGEALNNGTHFVDLARWGLGVEYPTKVSSNGGRYRYDDDWETPDTQIINLEFDNNSLMTWEGRSCNGRSVEGSSVGVMFYGENGSLVIESGNSYKVYDLNNKLIKAEDGMEEINANNLSDPSQFLDILHIQNFFDAIRKGTPLNSDIDGGHKSTLLVQLGNIALRSGQNLKIDPKNGHILDNKEAMKYWSREYAPGWEKLLY